MNIRTYFEIFDYLHALDVFTGFTSLNGRIASILQSIPLRIIISSDHCRRQNIYDTIRDDTYIISSLFTRHKVTNLQPCTFVRSSSLTKLENVIKQIPSLNRLVSFTIQQPNNEGLNKNDKHDLTQIMLTHKSSSLRSLVLQYSYDYLDIFNYTSIPLNLTSFKMELPEELPD